MALAFWVALGLLVYTQVGYGVLLAGWFRLRLSGTEPDRSAPGARPSVSVIVAAHREADVIGARVANLRALAYRPAPEVIVAVDGADPGTVAAARAAGADVVLELARGGKTAAQNAGVAAASGELLAFSDANTAWAADALDRLVDAFGDRTAGYVCGQVRFRGPDGSTNQEGLYWRYEMFLRARESSLASITAGNGAIYAVRRAAWVELDPRASHDLALPFTLVKAGWSARYAPAAMATEKMAASIEGEFARKRRMAAQTWPSVVRGGMLSPRGYPPAYALMIVSHRLLRYLSPLLHLLALVLAALLVARGWVYGLLFAGQLALLAIAVGAPVLRWRVAWVARYYVWTTASLAAGFWDWLAGRSSMSWDRVEETR